MNRTIQVRLVASTAQFQAAMGTAAAQTKALDRDMRQMAVNGDQSMRMLGKGMLVAGGLIAGGLALSVGKAMEFETQMRNVNSIAKMSEEQFAATSGQVLALSRKVPQSAATLAQGLYDIASSGFAGADGLKILEASAIAATAGMTSSDVAAKAITATLNAYGRNARDAGDISDVLFKTVEVGVITFEELASGMGDWIGMAAAAKVPVDEAAAAIAAMTLVGVPAAEAGTSLNRVLQSLISPSEALAEKLKDLGYESGAQALQADGLRGVMEKLRVATGGNIEQIQALFPEVRALRGVLALTANEGRNFGNTIDAITDKAKRAGAAKAAYAEQSKALSVQLDLAKSSATAFAIEVGNRMLPILTALAKEVAGVFDGFSGLPGPVITAGTALAGLSAVALVLGGSLLMLAPKLHAANVLLHGTSPAAMAASAALSKLWAAASGAGMLLVMAASADAAHSSLQKWTGMSADVDKLTASLSNINVEASFGRVVTDELGFSIEELGRRIASTSNQNWLEDIITPTTKADVKIRALDESLARLVEEGHLDQAQAMFRALAEEVRRNGGSVDDLEAQFVKFTPAARKAAAASDEVSAAAEEERRKIAELNEVLGNSTTAAEEMSEAQKMIQERIDGVNKSIASFSDPINSYNAALEFNKEKAQEWADAQNEGLEKTKVSWEDYPGLVKEGLKGEALAANKEAAREWAEAQNEAIGKAKVTWEDYPGGVVPALTEIEIELDKNQKAFDNWSGNLVTLVQKGYGALAMELAAKGPEYAGLVQQFVDAPDAELARIAPKWVGAQRRATEDAAAEIIKGSLIQTEVARQGAQATVDTVAGVLDLLPDDVRRIAEEMGLEIDNATPGWRSRWDGLGSWARRAMENTQREVPPLARGAAEGANREVQASHPTWYQSWADRYRTSYGQVLAMRRDVPPIAGDTGWAMNTLLGEALPPFRDTVGGYTGALEHGVRVVSLAGGWEWRPGRMGLTRSADGNIIDFYAQGGFKEDHRAQIARAGDWRVWAEPETGGEAYIPLARSKKAQSVPIWLETGRRLGLDEESVYSLREAMAFHSGGMWNVPRRPDLDQWGHPIRPRGEATLDNAQRFAEELARRHMELPHHQVGSGLAGSTAGLNPEFLRRFNLYSDRVGGLRIVSGFRSRAQQERLYALYLSGRGNLAARPGTSKHERGLAIDHAPHSTPSMRQIARDFRLHYPVRGEPWHVEPFARGGILNPWVRDRGGPLMPGYTLNGSGRPERVVSELGDFSEATDQASRVGEAVLDALLSGVEFRAGGVPQTFAEVGGGIAQGMAGGLRAGVPDVWSAMSMFSETMPAKVKTQLGIESPSSVFHGYGHSVATGYANGIRAGIPAALAAYADLMRASGMVQAEDGTWVPRSFYAPRRLIHEDDPRFNWRTMGNRMRGIQDRRGYWYHEHADGRITNTHPRNLGAPMPPRFHSGGFVSSSLPTTTGLRLDERLLIAQVGEAVVPKQQVIPTPVSASASSGAPTVVNIQATYELHVEGEITDRTERKLRSMLDQNNRELARMVKAGVR